MLQWAIIFFVIALVAALLGQRGVAGLSAQIGYLFVGVAVIFLLVALLSGRGLRKRDRGDCCDDELLHAVFAFSQWRVLADFRTASVT